MNRLHAELQRLYLPLAPLADIDDEVADASEQPPSELLDAHGRSRALVLEVQAPVDWVSFSALWRGVQADLGLPAPAIAVSGHDALQLWFSLAQPVGVAAARAFLHGLRRRYLADVPTLQVRLWPAVEASAQGGATHTALVPARQADEGQWSAFVAPDLAPVFTETPWLDMPPGDEGQASLLRGLESLSPLAWAAALEQLGAMGQAPAVEAAEAATMRLLPGGADRELVADAPTPASRSQEAPSHGPGAGVSDPRQFLLEVMRDERVALPLRIEAAKALLPHRGG